MPTLMSEGSTDTRFYVGLLRRVLEDVLFTRAVRGFEIADLFELGDTSGLVEPDVVCAELESRGAWAFSMVFVHRDADARDDSKSAPWVEGIRGQLVDERWSRLVLIIPVRMTEAWVLADGDALRAALGVSWSDEDLGVPMNPADVEKISEPKSTIRSVVDRLRGPSVDVHSRVGERVSLEVLRRVPAYRDMETHLVESLASQGVIE